MKKKENEISLSADEIVEAADGKMLSRGRGDCFTNVSTDSREIKPGGIFFALKGGRSDGHNYLHDAVKNGASLCVVDKITGSVREIIENRRCSLILADDSLKALQKTAGFYRDKFKDLRIVGITGSCGKTTTKELTGRIVSMLGSTVVTEGNLNSEIGLPLSIFKIRDFHEYGVFEMGINHFGEMDILVGMLHPQIAVITNIGTAHIGIFGTKERIAEEKVKIFTKNPSFEKGFVFEEDDYAGFLKKAGRGAVSFFGPGSMLSGRAEIMGIEGSRFTLGKTEIRFPLTGEYNVNNALAAAAAGRYMGASDIQIKDALESVTSLFGRGELYRYGEITVLFDCYNANFESMSEVIKFAAAAGKKFRRIVFAVGSLLELGSSSGEIHGKIGELLSESGASGVFLFGKEMSPAFEVLKDKNKNMYLCWSEDMKEVENEFLAFVKAGDFVVIKGSRGMAMERIIEGLGKGEKQGA